MDFWCLVGCLWLCCCCVIVLWFVWMFCDVCWLGSVVCWLGWCSGCVWWWYLVMCCVV